jgi:hypothetical protein
MVEDTAKDDQAELTRGERWAKYVLRHASGSVGAVIALVVALSFAAVALSRGAPVLWPFAAIMVAISLLYWERAGFGRLLARRDAEIERLRSTRGSAQQAHQPDAPEC